MSTSEPNLPVELHDLKNHRSQSNSLMNEPESPSVLGEHDFQRGNRYGNGNLSKSPSISEGFSPKHQVAGGMIRSHSDDSVGYHADNGENNSREPSVSGTRSYYLRPSKRPYTPSSDIPEEKSFHQYYKHAHLIPHHVASIELMRINLDHRVLFQEGLGKILLLEMPEENEAPSNVAIAFVCDDMAPTPDDDISNYFKLYEQNILKTFNLSRTDALLFRINRLHGMVEHRYIFSNSTQIESTIRILETRAQNKQLNQQNVADFKHKYYSHPAVRKAISLPVGIMTQNGIGGGITGAAANHPSPPAAEPEPTASKCCGWCVIS